MKPALRSLLTKRPSGGGPFDDPETGRVGPELSLQSIEPRVGTPPGRLHVRETLRSGQVRFHGQTETRAPTYHLLVDGGASLEHGMVAGTIEEFSDFAKAWQQNHGLRGSVVVNRTERWGSGLWTLWHEFLERESPGCVFILSDFHGPMPDGPFWKVLTSRFWPRVIRFRHPKPSLEKRGEFKDCSSGERHLYDPIAFGEAFSQWDEGLKGFFRKAGIDSVEVEDGRVEALAEALVRLS